MDFILYSVKWQFALAYLDNVVIFSKTSRQIIKHVREVLQLFHRSRVSNKVEKRTFFKDTIDYMAFYIC